MEAPSMIKIGKLNRFLGLLVFCLGCFATSHAQDVEVSASLSETNIFSGEQVKIEITISGTSMGSVEQPELPEIDGLRWLRGSSSRGTKYAVINGNPSVTHTFGFALIAQTPGSYTVPSIQVEVNDEQYHTDPIEFKILDPAAIKSEDAERTPDIYIQLEPNTKNPVVGEQVIVDIVLYFKNGIEIPSYQTIPGWKAEGFWKEELQHPQRTQTSSTIVNGTRYNKAVLVQYALFPTKSGELTISPFEVTVSVRKQRGSNPFGFGLGQERMNVLSQPVTLNVQNLPEIENAEFIGAVGNFDISRELSLKSALVGESIEITTKIEGSGNVPLVNKPEYDFPESLEKYTPQERSDISRLYRQVSGTRLFTDILVARNEGSFSIPEKKVAYYNPVQKRYIIETLPKLTFTARRDPNSTAVVQNNLRFEIKPITGLAHWTTTAPSPLYQKIWVWVLIFFPLFLTAGAYGYKKYHDRMQTDTAFARSRTATDKAEKTLSEAESVNDIKQGYHLIEKTLVQFITDKLNLPPAGLSNQDIIHEIEKLGDSEITTELKRLLTKCETIAYAPNTSKESLDSDIKKTRSLLKKVGKQV